MCEKLVLLVISAMTVLALAACGRPLPETVTEPVVEGPVDIPNPIAVYCTELGYEYTTRERKIDAPEPQPETSAEPTLDTLGTPQPGVPVVPDYILEIVCVFPDGAACEECEFISGRCGQEHSYCVQQGYTLEPGANMATCVFPDGSSCLEIEFFDGDCGPARVEAVEPPSAEPRPLSHSVELREGETHIITLDVDRSNGKEWDVEYSEAP